MNKEETIKLLSDKQFLDKLYGFAYKRCSTSHEAEDLTSDIILSMLRTINKNVSIKNFYAFAWTVAHRTYADYSKNRKIRNDMMLDTEYSDEIINMQIDETDYFKANEESEQLQSVIREISFLSKIYRDVMIMYYIDEIKIAEIAQVLDISETAVKQRLFSARNIIKKEVTKMDSRNLSLKPVRFNFMGSGNPVNNDPSEQAMRTLSQSIVYMCKKEAKSAKEISDALSIPMLFVEEELEIQCRGVNGNYGLLRKLSNGKYISNIIIADTDEAMQASAIYKEYLPEIVRAYKKAIEKEHDKIFSFPFLSKQNDAKFILWSALPMLTYSIIDTVNNIIENEYFADIESSKQDYTLAALVQGENESIQDTVYGCDAAHAYNICGYRQIEVINLYGPRIKPHFHCRHNIATDDLLLMTIRAIGGLDVNVLSVNEKEIAAKAIESGYLRKTGNIIEPKVIVITSERRVDFYNIFSSAKEDLDVTAHSIAQKMAVYIKKTIPKHLLSEYKKYNELVASRELAYDLSEELIKSDLLTVPENKLCAEGVVIIVNK